MADGDSPATEPRNLADIRADTIRKTLELPGERLRT